MAILEDKQKEQLKEIFQRLDKEVQVLLFSQEFECPHCKLTREMIEEVAALSDKIKLSPLDFVRHQDEAEKHGVDKIPALIIRGEKDYGIRYFGVPAGYEFTSVIEDLLMVSSGKHGLAPETLAELEKIDQPVRLQVFVSPTCPYCPKAVRAAHKLALASDLISADMVETTGFPHLVQKFEVSGVPHTQITDDYGFVGPVAEKDLATEILIALGKKPPTDSVLHQRDHEHERKPEKSKTTRDKKPRQPAKKPKR